MNILIINHYAGSPEMGMEFRPYYLAREWIKLGHRVRIIGATFSHLRRVQPQAGRQDIDGIEYDWIETAAYEGNGLGRVRNMMAFASALYSRAPEIAKDFKPHYVIASSTYPFDIYGARRIVRHSVARLVFEVHDLWPLSPMELGGMPAWHPFIIVTGIAEKTAVKSAHTVVSILPKTRDYLAGIGMPKAKWYYIPNGIVVDGNRTLPPVNHIETVDQLKGKFIVGYAGAHGLANDLDTLVAAARATENPSVHFVLVGQGPERERLRDSAQGLKNITFLDAVPKTSIPDLLDRFDILYFGLKQQPLFRFGISPNKVLDYMMAGKPIIQAVEAGNDPVKDADCGLTVPPGNPRAIVEAVERLATLDSRERTAMGERGRSYVLANHDYQALAERFLAFLEYREPLNIATG